MPAEAEEVEWQVPKAYSLKLLRIADSVSVYLITEIHRALSLLTSNLMEVADRQYSNSMVLREP